MNSAFVEGVSHPVRKLVEHIVPQGGQIEEADEASGSDAYLSSEDTAEYKKVATPLESVLVATQAAQAAELEWDAAGCTLDTDSCDKEQTEELVLCNAVEGNICCFRAFEKAHLCSLADWILVMEKPYSRLSLKFQVSGYMQLVGGELYS